VNEIFVPTRNSGRTLARCLATIMGEIPCAEITVIDNYSTDDTLEIAKQYDCKVVQSHFNLGEARTYMCESATKPWFFMVDSDVYLSDGWYESIIKEKESLLCKDPMVGVIQSNNVDTPTITSEKVLALQDFITWRHSARKNYPIKNPKRLLTCAVYVRKEAVRGFKTKVSAYEDYLLGKYVNEKGYNVYLVNARVYHDELISLETFKKRNRCAGAFETITGFSTKKRILAALFYTPLFKAPWGTKQIAFRAYWNYLVGAFNQQKYLGGKWNEP